MSNDGLASVPSSMMRGGAVGFINQDPNNSDLQNPNQNPNLLNPNPTSNNTSNPAAKRKRNLPGTPDPDAEVIALSPKSLMATNRFICEICNKGFQRDQNLQLHRRGHNLPWKLKQRNNKEIIRKKVYICPEKSCVHHDPSRALGDLTGIKKHYSRKHGEKKWKCEKCSKKYAVQSDWKAHSKICGTREYKCDCGTLFSRKDSFITHRAFCDALAEESARFTTTNTSSSGANHHHNFRNELLFVNGGNGNGNPQHFAGALLRPDHHISVLDHPVSGELNLDGQKARGGGGGLPMWLDNSIGNSSSTTTTNNSSSFQELVHHHHQLLQQTTTPPCTNNLVTGLMTSSSHHHLHHHQDQWFINRSNNNNATTSSAGLQGILMKEEDEEEENRISAINNNTTSNNLTPMYNYHNTPHHHHHQGGGGATGHMSATALLQKAAQMGSTRSSINSSSPSSSAPSLFSGGSGGGFGLMQLASFNQRRSINQGENNLNGLMMMTSASQGQGDQGLVFGSTSNASLMANSNKLAAESSLTRDFLGVGGSESRRFLQQQQNNSSNNNSSNNEVVKFSSLGN